MLAAYLLVADIDRFVPNAVKIKKKNIRSLLLNLLRSSNVFPYDSFYFTLAK